MTGRIVSAQEALESGLVNQLCTPESLLLAAYELAKQIIENTAPVSIALTRQLLWKGLGLNHPMDAHLLKSHGVSTRGKSADAEEGTQSFLEKRPARFPMTVSEDMPAFYPWWQKREYK
ncbi:MAG: enoyl-CoA hydratase-related protein [Candidatus Thiodiazotropha sp.]